MIIFEKNHEKVIKNNVDLRQQREERDRKERNKEKDIQREIRLKEKEEAKRREEAAKLRSYDYVMKTENMSTNEVCFVFLQPFHLIFNRFFKLIHRLVTIPMISCEIYGFDYVFFYYLNLII